MRGDSTPAPITSAHTVSAAARGADARVEELRRRSGAVAPSPLARELEREPVACESSAMLCRSPSESSEAPVVCHDGRDSSALT